MDREQKIQRVAVLCPHPRLRRLLRLSLMADGYDVVEWSSGSRPRDRCIDAVVADLDSLRQAAQGVLTLLCEWCIARTTPLLFISVYPLELRSLGHGGAYDGLQPPFPPEELADRIRRLFEQARSEPAHPVRQSHAHKTAPTVRVVIRGLIVPVAPSGSDRLKGQPYNRRRAATLLERTDLPTRLVRPVRGTRCRPR